MAGLLSAKKETPCLQDVSVFLFELDGRHRLFADERERNIIRNIVDLAGVFGARVCVEGIETAAMRDILREFRVKSFQGYYYAKPLPPEKMMDD